jgi:hypothetical protein
MMIALIILSVWFIPVLLLIVIGYFLMEKGQSVEEFVKEYDLCDEFMVFALLPFVNIAVTVFALCGLFYIKCKNLRK